MKRLLIIFLASALLAGCSSSNSQTSNDTNQSNVVTNELGEITGNTFLNNNDIFEAIISVKDNGNFNIIKDTEEEIELRVETEMWDFYFVANKTEQVESYFLTLSRYSRLDTNMITISLSSLNDEYFNSSVMASAAEINFSLNRVDGMAEEVVRFNNEEATQADQEQALINQEIASSLLIAILSELGVETSSLSSYNTVDVTYLLTPPVPVWDGYSYFDEVSEAFFDYDNFNIQIEGVQQMLTFNLDGSTFLYTYIPSGEIDASAIFISAMKEDTSDLDPNYGSFSFQITIDGYSHFSGNEASMGPGQCQLLQGGSINDLECDGLGTLSSEDLKQTLIQRYINLYTLFLQEGLDLTEMFNVSID